MKKQLYRTEYFKENGGGRLDYFLLMDSAAYGVGICMGLNGSNGVHEGAYAEDVTTDKEKAELLIKYLAQGQAQPVHLYEIIENYFGGESDL